MADNAMTTAQERHAERMGLRDGAPCTDILGLAGNPLTGEVSSGDQRLSQRTSMAKRTAFRATAPKRHRVKPSGGKVADIYRPPTAPGQDDGTDYFRHAPMPKPKTAWEDALVSEINRWNSGGRTDDRRIEIKRRLDPIRKRNPERANAFEATIR